ncbi:MAPEG family protein [Pseudoduganella plicata]|uniref:MAPEG family protein n=3 Tax=Pseudoduganella plicata TaxID=321984 RepID=A0AA87YBH6_9BURK|nr:MAPEG family protein [Pseudoduganella plicata]GGY87516.1 hypothetical protein GCM10007388_21060 [Pseudoduganella plicata]
MSPTIAQRGVLRAMAAGFVMSVVALVLSALVRPSNALPGMPYSHLQVLALASLAPTVTLAACIARLAAHRFHTPEDLDGSGLTAGTATAKLLQAQLQNTLEQLVLALPVYAACVALGPAYCRNPVLAASVLFFCGRLLFFAGYRRGAAGRAFGFALTFYPTVVLLAGMIIHAALAAAGIIAGPAGNSR